MDKVSLEDIVSLCKRRGFIYQGSEIYGGLAGTWDYGPLGTLLKRNIINEWLKFFVDGWDDMYQIDSAILMNPKVWQASGHTETFSDPMVECSNCHAQLRADHILEDAINFNEDELKQAKCPNCGQTGTLGQTRQFNLMFKTTVGPLEGDENISYLRPETAQGMFVNFKNVLDSFSPNMPFGMAQIGKAFRNEIAPRDFIFRVRELEQMEIEYFIRPSDWERAFEEWRKGVHEFNKAVGIPAEAVHELEVADGDRAHYSKRTIDFEFDFPFGRKELYGLAYRTDFDLTNHKLDYVDEEKSEKIVPHVIEPSIGVDRAILALLTSAYAEDEKDGEVRSYLKFKPSIAPVICAVSPLLRNKPELVA